MIGTATLPVIFDPNKMGGSYRVDTSDLPAALGTISSIVLFHDGQRPADLSDATEAFCYVEYP